MLHERQMRIRYEFGNTEKYKIYSCVYMSQNLDKSIMVHYILRYFIAVFQCLPTSHWVLEKIRLRSSRASCITR